MGNLRRPAQPGLADSRRSEAGRDALSPLPGDRWTTRLRRRRTGIRTGRARGLAVRPGNADTSPPGVHHRAHLAAYCGVRKRTLMRASRAFERTGRPGHSGRAGIIRSDEHVTFPPLPGDRHPPAGHPLPDLRPYPRLPARQHQRGLDRALPPDPSRSARHPRPVAEPRSSPAGDAAPDVARSDEPAAGLSAGRRRSRSGVCCRRNPVAVLRGNPGSVWG